MSLPNLLNASSYLVDTHYTYLNVTRSIVYTALGGKGTC